MATEIVKIVRDDIDQSEGAEPVEFTLDGVSYTIDLAQKNAEKLRKALAPFIERATVVEAPKVPKGGRKAPAGPSNARDVQAQRAWWADEENQAKHSLPGFSDRGRIPGTVVEAWKAAGSPR